MWTAKRVGEKPIVGFNYANTLAQLPGETIVSAVWRITVLEGTDPNPSAMLAEGEYIISGSHVLHKLVGGVAGTLYEIFCDATLSDGQVITLSETLQVIASDATFIEPDIKTRIREAEAKLHQLLTGTNVVTLSYGDRQVQYRNYATDIEKLQGYIAQLKTEAGIYKSRRPIGIIW